MVSRKKRIYIASSVYNIDRVKEWQECCRLLGFEIAYDWTKHGKVDDDDPRREEYAVEELTAVMGCDVLLVLLPGGRGTHVEIGAALACGTPVLIAFLDKSELSGRYGYPCMFYDHPDVSLHRLNSAAATAKLTLLLRQYATDEAS